jgi:hypothetical protein
MKDLAILTPDKNTQFALMGALGRHEALVIRPIKFEFIVHPGRDGGVRKTGAELLRLERKDFSHALLLLDFEGSGTAYGDAITLEKELDIKLAKDWGADGKAIVIQPELDIWMWGTDNVVERAIGWPADGPRLRDWLRGRGFEIDYKGKPARPKEALEGALRVSKRPRSSALYEEISRTVSLAKCSDDAFLRLRKQLADWFPQVNH